MNNESIYLNSVGTAARRRAKVYDGMSNFV
jgi:hypothetical protein